MGFGSKRQLPIYRSNMVGTGVGQMTVTSGLTAKNMFFTLAGYNQAVPFAPCIVRLRKMGVSMHVAVAAETNILRATFHMSANTGGTGGFANGRPLRRQDPVALVDGQVWAVSGTTPGTLHGVMEARAVLIPLTGGKPEYVEFDFTNGGEHEGIELRTELEMVGLSFQTVPVNTYTMVPWLEYSEERSTGSTSYA